MRLLLFAMIIVLGIFSTHAFARKGRRPYKGPVIAALSSCNSKSPNDACEFTGSNNQIIQGHCYKGEKDEVSYCLPNGSAPPVNAKPVKDPNPKPAPAVAKPTEDGFKPVGEDDGK